MLTFLHANKRHILELLGAGLLVNVFLLVFPLYSQIVYDKLIGNGSHETLWALTVGIALMFALDAILRIARVYVIEHAGARWDIHLDDRLMKGVLAAPISQSLPIGKVLARYRELSSARDILSSQFILPLADLPFLLLLIVAVFAVGGALCLVPISAGVGVAILGRAFHHQSHRHALNARSAADAKLDVMVDILAAREGLMSDAASRAALARFKDPSTIGSRISAKTRFWNSVSMQIMPSAMSATSVAMLVTGVYLVEAQLLSVGGLIAANMLTMRAMGMVSSVAMMASRWGDFTRALNGLKDTVDLDAKPLRKSDHLANGIGSEGLRLDDISFKYPGQDRFILKQIDINLKPIELVSIVGASGSGKSTLLRLLGGHLQHTGGRLVFGGHVIESDPDRRWLCSRVSFKPQDPAFLSGTLAEVLLAGREGVSDATMLKSLREVGLGPVIDRGELGLNSNVGTNGVGLSGGQRQMVALARALLSGAEVLVLDEPTLGLDRNAQELLIGAISHIKGIRCVVVATHAAELIDISDRVFVLDAGHVVAVGPPGNLTMTRKA